jgi:dTMP kinase
LTQGRFITFEGGEGGGKSTQLKALARMLRETGYDVIETREPGGSPMGERIRDMLLDPQARLDPVAQLLLFSAARRDHVQTLIAPALARGTWVLCDRFADSSRAYQGAAGSVDMKLLRTIERAAVSETQPDLTIILDIAPEIALPRAHARRGKTTQADAFESADLAFHQRVRQAFLAIASEEPKRCVVIDANATVEVVASHVAAAVRARLQIEADSNHG